MAFIAVGSFVLALLIGHVGALTCYDCQKLDSDADFYTCLQNPTSVTTVTCTGDEDTCQATLVNNGWLHVVKRACATASVCAEAKNDTITAEGHCCQNDTVPCNDQVFELPTTTTTTTLAPTTTVKTTTTPTTTMTTNTFPNTTAAAIGQAGGMSAGAIAGCSVAGVVVPLMAAGAIYYYIKHKKDKQDSVTEL
ncbi:uncharacterized protein [Branchiostoma lanceolatum]|uniref:uncharacterized protein n=1 Tax=Branchiostoma lanceolatum TaxID=7740 RepID=UPI0034559C9C